MKLTLILAGLAAAGIACAQSEQWLVYHSSNNGRAYQTLELTTNAPPGVALPKMSASPFFALWKTPMDTNGGRWMCLDRTHKSGPYDRLFIDSNGNGRLDDKSPLQARHDAYNAYFPATRIIFKGGDGPITYHLILRFYQYEKNKAELLAASGCWYEGDVNFGTSKKHIQLTDGNVNGAFNDTTADPYESDRVQIEEDRAGERFLGKMLEVDGNLFATEVARDGAFIRVKPVPPGKIVSALVRVPENISEFAAFGENGYFIRSPAKGEFTMPAGKYRIVRWVINRKDERGVPWTLTGHDFPETATFEAAGGNPVTLDIGEPVRAVLKADEQADRHIRFDLNFIGHQKESIEMLRNNQRPRGPKLMLADASGALCYTNTFEFG